MGKFVRPKAFLIARTSTNESMIQKALGELGVESWQSDADEDAAELTEVAGKLCYMSFDLTLNENLTKVNGRTNEEYIQKGIIGNKHGSVLEHSSVTFLLTNVSRVVTHELIRHRAGTAFSQTSGRYVRSSEIDMFVPSCIEHNEEAMKIFKRAMLQQEDNIMLLGRIFDIDNQPFARKKELTSAFRRITGNGIANNIVVTANHRAWRHMIEMRTDVHAEEEIRITYAEIARQLVAEFPAIYGDVVIIEHDDGIPQYTFKNSKV